VPDIVEDGVTGLLVPPGEPGPLAEGLRRLLSDPGLRARFARAARTRAEERFALHTTVTRYAELFRSLVRRRAA
jgi:rhamnosyl/mannosyltransferase